MFKRHQKRFVFRCGVARVLQQTTTHDVELGCECLDQFQSREFLGAGLDLKEHVFVFVGFQYIEIKMDVHIVKPAGANRADKFVIGNVGCEALDAGLLNVVGFRLVQIADSNQKDLIGLKVGKRMFQQTWLAIAQQHPQWHSVKVTAGGLVGGVEVGVSVEPNQGKVVIVFLVQPTDWSNLDRSCSTEGKHEIGRMVCERLFDVNQRLFDRSVALDTVFRRR